MNTEGSLAVLHEASYFFKALPDNNLRPMPNADTSKFGPSLGSRALAYIRCGVTEEWQYLYVARNRLSKSTGNSLYLEQWNAVRRLCRRWELNIERRFFDCEGNNFTLRKARPLLEREELIAAVVEARKNDVGVIVIDCSSRLDESQCVSMLLAKRLQSLGIQVVEAKRNCLVAKLTSMKRLKLEVPPAEFAASVKAVARWTRRVSTALNEKAGKCRPYGGKAGEQAGVDRIRQLNHVLPRSQWKGLKCGRRLSAAEIANRLNAEGLPTRTGKRWRSSTVAGIMKRLKLARN